ncbi:MAG: hypothetical protein CMH54_04625 [Myxococcales bacterium]|nr:hypothetical protein [Myxococcales bacterium]
MNVDFAARTECGPVRDRNEDNYLIDPNMRLFIVADGVGGRPGGGTASALCVNLTRAVLKRHRHKLFEWLADEDEISKTKISLLLERALSITHQGIRQKATERPDFDGMGSTLTLLLLGTRFFYVGHVGDSRLYTVQDNTVRQLTHDQSLAGDLSQNDTGTDNSPFRNVGVRALGVSESLKPEVSAHALGSQCGFLLCTDGLYDGVGTEDLEAYLSAHHEDPPDELIAELLESALARGGSDNATAIWVHFFDDAAQPPVEIDTVSILQQVPMFSAVPQSVLQKLADEAETRSLKEGEILFREGETTQHIHILAQGSVVLTVGGSELETRNAVCALGGEQIAGSEPRMFTAKAQEPTLVLSVTSDSLDEIFADDPDNPLLWNVAQKAAEQLAVHAESESPQTHHATSELVRPNLPPEPPPVPIRDEAVMLEEILYEREDVEALDEEKLEAEEIYDALREAGLVEGDEND